MHPEDPETVIGAVASLVSDSIVDDVFEKITEIREESDTAVLMIEQNARRALAESDRGLVLDLGEKRMEGTGAELLDSREVQELYLGA